MYKLLRMLLFMRQPRITRQRALEIAQNECERLGWWWRDPVVAEGLRNWCIWTVGGVLGSAFIVVSQQTGEVVKRARSFPR